MRHAHLAVVKHRAVVCHEAPNVDMATQPTVQLDPSSVSSDPKKSNPQLPSLRAKLKTFLL